MQCVAGLFYGRAEFVMKFVVALMVFASIVGCSSRAKDELKLYPVKGVVLYNDEPLEGAAVSFWTEKSARAGTGITNDKGEFSLSTPDGASQITVTKSLGGVKALPSNVALKDPAAVAASNAVPEVKKKVSKKDPPPPKPLVPVKYTTRNDTPLKETVSVKGPNKFEFKLTD